MKTFLVISCGATALDAQAIVASSDARVINAALREIARVGRGGAKRSGSRSIAERMETSGGSRSPRAPR